MKKSLYILLTVALCLLIFCAACGKDGTIDNNTDKTPDNTPITDPDTTLPDGTADDKQNDVTPPDSTADDKQNDTTPPDSTADDKQNDTTPSDSTTADKQGDNDTAPPVQDDNKDKADDKDTAGDNNDSAEDSKPDDTQQTDDTPYQLDPAVITEEYLISLIETIEERCNFAPFYFFNFEDASQLSADSLLRAFVVLTRGKGIITPSTDDTNINDYAKYAVSADITAELDKWFKNFEFDITQCSSYVHKDDSDIQDMVYTVYDNPGWEGLSIKVLNLNIEGNIVTFTAKLKEGWVKEYAIEFYNNGYYFLKAKEIESPKDTSSTNTEALNAYYAFLKNECKAIDVRKETARSYNEIISYGNGTVSADPSLMKFGFADFGSDGILELVLEDGNNYLKYYVIIFYENGQLYLDTVTYRGMLLPSVNGVSVSMSGGSTGSYVIRTFSAEQKGQQTQVAAYQTSATLIGGKYYHIYYDIVDGNLVERADYVVTESEFDEYIARINNAPLIKFFPVEYTDRLKQEYGNLEFYGLFEWAE